MTIEPKPRAFLIELRVAGYPFSAITGEGLSQDPLHDGLMLGELRIRIGCARRRRLVWLSHLEIWRGKRWDEKRALV